MKKIAISKLLAIGFIALVTHPVSAKEANRKVAQASETSLNLVEGGGPHDFHLSSAASAELLQNIEETNESNKSVGLEVNGKSKGVSGFQKFDGDGFTTYVGYLFCSKSKKGEAHCTVGKRNDLRAHQSVLNFNK